jgi:hypothetical protein
MAMPWSKAKEKQRLIEASPDEQKRLTALFDACFRIQAEAIEAAGHHIPLIVENVRGAQKWVGRSRWNFGSFYLWGDVPALMPMAKSFKIGGNGTWFHGDAGNPVNNADGIKLPGNNSPRRWEDREVARLCDADTGIKGSIGYERNHSNKFGWSKPNTSSKSKARKAASAMIAKIPLPLSTYIARHFYLI